MRITDEGIFFDSVFEAVSELDQTFGRDNWLKGHTGASCNIAGVWVYVDSGLRFDPVTDQEYDTFHMLENNEALNEFKIRLS